MQAVTSELLHFANAKITRLLQRDLDFRKREIRNSRAFHYAPVFRAAVHCPEADMSHRLSNHGGLEEHETFNALSQFGYVEVH